MSSNGSSGGRFGFPFPSLVIPAFCHAFDMAGVEGGGGGAFTHCLSGGFKG